MQKDEIEKKEINFINRKKLSQPSQIKTCGSTFKNISNDKKAWMLIKDAGCINLKEGDAMISKNIATSLLTMVTLNPQILKT